MSSEVFWAYILPALETFGIYLAICLLVPPMFRRRAHGEQAGAAPDDGDLPPELVRPVETSRDALAARLALIGRARESIVLTTFIWMDDDAGHDICAALTCAALRGVHVRVLSDSSATSRATRRSSCFRTLASLPNVEVRLYNRWTPLTFWRINYRMHDKFLIADGSAYLLGGRNVSSHSLGDYLQDVDIDRDLLVEGADGRPGHSARQLAAYFEREFSERCARPFSPRPPKDAGATVAWARERASTLHGSFPELDDPAFPERGLTPAESIELLSNGTNPGNKVPSVLARIRELASRGRDVLVQTPYAVLDGSMFGHFPKFSRGQRTVRVLTNAPELGANIFGCGEYLVHWHGIRATGARILEWAHGPSMHAKTVLVDDDVSVVGSYNFDLRSTYLDTELMLAVRSRELNRQIRGRLSEMAKGCCTVEARALTRFRNSGKILARVRSESKGRLKAFFRVNLVHAKLAVARASGVLLLPYRYLM